MLISYYLVIIDFENTWTIFEIAKLDNLKEIALIKNTKSGTLFLLCRLLHIGLLEAHITKD